jgi:Carboxymuconolactone decarboxylase family
VPIDTHSPAAYRAQIDAARAVRRTARDAGLDRTLVELVNIRVSEINGCAVCLHVNRISIVSRYGTRPTGSGPGRSPAPAPRPTRRSPDAARTAWSPRPATTPAAAAGRADAAIR